MFQRTTSRRFPRQKGARGKAELGADEVGLQAQGHQSGPGRERRTGAQPVVLLEPMG